MRKTTIIAAAALAWTIGAMIGLAPAQAAKITVYRGLEKQTVDTAKRPTEGVHLARPAIKPAAIPAPTEATPTPRRRPFDAAFAAGNTLWLHDSNGQLVACTVWSAGIVGKDKIRCTSRDAYGR